MEAGSFLEFTRSYNKYGLNINKDGDLEYREWAPAAREVSLVIRCFINGFIYSLEILMVGTEKHINVQEMILVCGPLYYQRKKMVLWVSLMSLNSNVALLNRIGRRLIECQHGPSLLDKTSKIIYLRLYSGILQRLINGRIKDHLNQIH